MQLSTIAAIQPLANDALREGRHEDAQMYLDAMYDLGAEECDGKASCRCVSCQMYLAAYGPVDDGTDPIGGYDYRLI